MKTLHVTYTLDESFAWNVTIDELPGCFTFGKSIAQARGRIRDAVWVHTGDKKLAKGAEFQERFTVPKELSFLLAQDKEYREKLAAIEAQAAKTRAELVKKLIRYMKLSTRDAGELMGVSQQRIHQLARQKGAPGRHRVGDHGPA